MDETASLTSKESEALRLIRNHFVHRGRQPTVRDLMEGLRYSSPRAAAYILERLEAKGYVARHGRGLITLRRDLPETESSARTVEVPLVGTAPCGAPIMAEENVEAYLPVSTALARPPHKYFLLHAKGDSMTEKGIQDGNLVLVRQQPTAESGDPVVALIDGEATIKEFHRAQKAIVLKPRSKNPNHHPIILTHDFQVLGVIQSVIDL